MRGKLILKLGRVNVYRVNQNEQEVMIWNEDAKEDFSAPSDFQECNFSERQVYQFLATKPISEITSLIMAHNALQKNFKTLFEAYTGLHELVVDQTPVADRQRMIEALEAFQQIVKNCGL